MARARARRATCMPTAAPCLRLGSAAPRRAPPHPAAPRCAGTGPSGAGLHRTLSGRGRARCAQCQLVAATAQSRGLCRPPTPTGRAALRGPPAPPHTGRRQLLEALLAVGPAFLHLVGRREGGEALGRHSRAASVMLRLVYLRRLFIYTARTFQSRPMDACTNGIESKQIRSMGSATWALTTRGVV